MNKLDISLVDCLCKGKSYAALREAGAYYSSCLNDGSCWDCYFTCEYIEKQTFRAESHLCSDCAYRAKHLSKESGPSVYCEDRINLIVTKLYYLAT